MAEDKIIKKLLEHDEKLKELVTKREFREFRNEVLAGQDKILTIVQRLDQERVFTNEKIKRLEESVKIQQVEINKIKEVLKVS